MKIVQLLSGFNTAITNEEQQFIEKYPAHVKITSLEEHSSWVAQNLVRKGVYAISKDNNVIVKNLHETGH